MQAGAGLGPVVRVWQLMNFPDASKVPLNVPPVAVQPPSGTLTQAWLGQAGVFKGEVPALITRHSRAVGVLEPEAGGCAIGVQVAEA